MRRHAASRRSPGTKDDFGYSRRLAQEVTEKGVAALVVDTGLDERFAASESLVISGVRTLMQTALGKAGVNMNYVYATGCNCSGKCDCECDVVVSAPDPKRVVEVWQKLYKKG